MVTQSDFSAFSVKMKNNNSNQFLQNRLLGGLVKIITSITIEPAMFILTFGDICDEVSLSQMIIDKSCRSDFDFNETVCDNLTSYEHENADVQDEVSHNTSYLFSKLCSNMER